MNKRDMERYLRVYEEGKQAFLAGKSLADCPYKRSTWGAGSFWDVGWTHAEAEHRKKIVEDTLTKRDEDDS